ncbi:hypothetical protein PR001_g10208 [Phytophthora rubi]|nr:hypothetical protein PR001_g10208 [Phytophthora rubi]
MQSLFHRCRVARSKPVTVTRTVTMQSLDAAWTSFVRRWDVEGPVVFIRGLERREEEHQARAVSALAKQVHDASYDTDRDCCFVHYADSCKHCRGYNLPQPNGAKWRRLIAATPLTRPEEGLIARYREARDNARRGGRPRHVEDLPPLEGWPHTPPRNPARLPAGPRGAPTYPALAPVNAQDTDSAWEHWGRGRERRDADEQHVEQHDDRRAPGSPPRYGERYHRYPQAAQGRHAETVQRDRREDAEEEQRRRRAAAPGRQSLRTQSKTKAV